MSYKTETALVSWFGVFQLHRQDFTCNFCLQVRGRQAVIAVFLQEQPGRKILAMNYKLQQATSADL